MKRILISFTLIATIIISFSIPAFATKKFNLSILNELEGISVSSDEMTGSTSAFPHIFTPEEGRTYIVFDDSSRAVVNSYLYLTDSYDFYYLSFSHVGYSFAGLNSIIVKIGTHRYTFKNCAAETIPLNNGMFYEELCIPMKKEVIPFMNDLINHSNEEIKIRYVGANQNYDFSLTVEMKYTILRMYDLYVSGGGMSEKNMHDLTEIDSTVVEKDGKIVKGNIAEKVLVTALQTFFDSYPTKLE